MVAIHSSMLLRSRTVITRLYHNIHTQTTGTTVQVMQPSTTTKRSFSSSSSEMQMQSSQQLSPSHVQLPQLGMTFATLQQQNHMWMMEVC